MSGVTNAAFRRLIKRLNPNAVGLLISEFISVEGMTRNQRRSLEMMKFYADERPFGIQIFGYDPQRMRDAALMVQDVGADLVDINCGCPAPKVVRNGGGCELMRQPAHLSRILSEVRRAVTIPLTMKFRSGWDAASLNAVEIARLAEAEGVQALAVHGRTRAQLYRGSADWIVVREVAESVKIPVLGSGDIVDFASAAHRLESSKACGLMIGRAALSNPLVFSQIAAGQPTLKLSEEQARKVLLEFMRLLLEDLTPRHCVGRIKQLVSQMCRGFVWSKALLRANSLEAQVEIIGRYDQAFCEIASGLSLPNA